MSKLGAWGYSSEPHEGELQDSNDVHGPETPDCADYGARGKHSAPPASSKPHTSTASMSAAALAAASSLLRRVPGARRASRLGATLLGLLGLGAALTACAGGSGALLVLLARWYLPAQHAHVSLPLHFDYAAGPAAAGAWLPLLRQTPATAVLTPPPHQQPLSAAAALSFQGSLGPGGSFSVASETAGGGSGGGLGFGRQLGFLGLGFGPASRAAGGAAGGRQRSSRGWLRGFGRRGGKASERGAAAAGAARRGAGVDVGSGVVVPEAEWLVPGWGRMAVAVELEVPRQPQPDLVQLTGELVSQQGIVLARTTRTWVPKPRPLAFRIADAFIFGPWRALGLKEDAVRVQLPLFDGFQNPQPPPGGWGSVAGLSPAQKPAAAPAGECMAPGGTGGSSSSSSKGSKVAAAEDGCAAAAAAAAAAEGEAGAVAGPRAMWLRVTMVGRSVGYGPPRVYSAAAHLHTNLGFWDKLAVALRPGLAASLCCWRQGWGWAWVAPPQPQYCWRWRTPCTAGVPLPQQQPGTTRGQAVQRCQAVQR
ncbi:hypothetical protein COO60DRAFT_22651 [Scenedesmus sp. NREL 46B-D3]|nr:hypothetical protein COO60DRAFT_22651 [Scenedesmus sp. NREL 46B-D3]